MDPRIARRAVAGALLAGLALELLFDRTALGVNVPIATVAVLGLTWFFSASRRPADPADWWLPAVAVVASLGPALRTDPTVVALDVLLILGGVAGWALALAGVAVTRRATETVALLLVDTVLGMLAGASLLLRRAGADGFLTGQVDVARRGAPVVRGVVVAIPVLVLFTMLLASADAVFGRGIEDALQLSFELDQVVQRGTFAGGAAWFVGGLLALAAGAYRIPVGTGWNGSVAVGHSLPGGSEAAWVDVPTGSDAGTPLASTAGRARRGATEALIVLAAVNVLFAVFAGVQVVFLFGGADTLASIGMTYSDYARQGYFQLVAVVGLAGLLLVGAHLVVGRTRAFIGSAVVLLALTGVILASAALRLRLYQEAYGWTELRFYVAASILWLAVGAGMAIALLWRDRMRWLAHGLAISAVAITLLVSALGPHAFVTSQNLARLLDPSLVAAGGRAGFDGAYAVSLSDDAIPELVAALDDFDAEDRATVLRFLEARREDLARDLGASGPLSWNLARERARQALGELPER